MGEIHINMDYTLIKGIFSFLVKGQWVVVIIIIKETKTRYFVVITYKHSRQCATFYNKKQWLYYMERVLALLTVNSIHNASSNTANPDFYF